MSVIIRLQYLPLTAAAADIRRYFEGLRIPDGQVHIVGGDDGDAFIGFASDEDARQAMRRDGGEIHGSKIRLLLSSRAEMTEVIDLARTGQLPKKARSPPIRTAPQDPEWSTQAPARNAFAPESHDYKPLYTRNEQRDPRSPPATHPSDRHPARSRYDGPNSMPAGRFNVSQPINNFPSAPLTFPAVTEKPKTEPYRQEHPADPVKSDPFANLPPHMRPPFGIPPPHMRHLFPNLNVAAPQKSNDREDGRSPPQHLDSRQLAERNRKSPSLKNESWRDSITEAKPWERHDRPPINGPASLPAMPCGRRTLLNQPSTVPAEVTSSDRPAFQTHRPFSDPPQATVSRYVHLSNLPPEMTRPSVLEQFISVPLTLSSVKFVYDSRGGHSHTLVRLDSDEAANKLLKRDGEQGIRIRPTTKVIFDEAVDGPLVPGPSPLVNDRARRPNMSDNHRNGRGSREYDDRRRNRRSRSRSPRRPTHRPHRSRSRSRDRESRRPPPPSRRRSRTPPQRQRSPPVRRGRQAPDRWCLELTNVPYKVSQPDLLTWMSGCVTPKLLVRTYYSDGNASDRWIAEFETSQDREKAFELREPIQGRNIRLKNIDNDYANEILAIEDRYGEGKKMENEQISMLAEIQIQKLNEMKEQAEHIVPGPPVPFPIPPRPLMSTPMPPIRGGGNFPSLPPRQNTNNRPSFFNLPPAPQFGPPGGPSFRGRGRGRGFGPAPSQRPMTYPLSGGRHSEQENFEDSDEKTGEMHIAEANEDFTIPVDAELLSCIGAPGCVIACKGFPKDVTLQDIVAFFKDYKIDENSVRIRMGDVDAPTGECVLAVESPEMAKSAVQAMNAKSLRDHVVHMCVASR